MLSKAGCTYISTKSHEINQIVGVLNGAKVHVNHGRIYGQLRIALYLTQQDGTEIKFLLNDAVPDRETYGDYQFGMGPSIPILSKSNIAEEIYTFAATLNVDPHCEDFISFYRKATH